MSTPSLFRWSAFDALRQLNAMPCWPDDFDVTMREVDLLARGMRMQQGMALFMRIKEIAVKRGYQHHTTFEDFHLLHVVKFYKEVPVVRP